MNHIYQLAFFPINWMLGNEAQYAATQGEENAWKEFIKTRAYFDWQIGGALRGSFTNKEDLISILTKEQDIYLLHEGWYDYALIEKHTLNQIDSFDLEVSEVETWFKFDLEQSKYVQIARPECLKGTCKFV